MLNCIRDPLKICTWQEIKDEISVCVSNTTWSPLAVRLSGVSATLVLTDSHKQPIPLFPPQIRRGQGKWWMASPLGCQGLLVPRWIISQKPPCSSITPTPHPKCDMDFLVCCWLFLKTEPRELKCSSYSILLKVCEQMGDASEEQKASAGTFPVSSRS